MGASVVARVVVARVVVARVVVARVVARVVVALAVRRAAAAATTLVRRLVLALDLPDTLIDPFWLRLLKLLFLVHMYLYDPGANDNATEYEAGELLS